jgi:hypothetical protein
LKDVPKILANFSAKKANCFSETDRKFVESVIVALYDSLENFDEHVQGSLAGKLNKLVGTDSIPVLPLGLLHRAFCIPLFVSLGLDHGLLWDLKTAPSMLLSTFLVFPGALQLASKFLSCLPSTRPCLDVCLGLFFFGNPIYLNSELPFFENMAKAIFLEGSIWGLLKRHRQMDDAAIFLPFNLVHVWCFAGFALLNRFWTMSPLTDKGKQEAPKV